MLLSGRQIGMYGVETDWYGCYAPQADAFRENLTIPIDNFRGPLYQMVLGATSVITGDTWEAGKLLNLLFSIACVILLWHITKELKFSDLASFVTVLALILTPAFLSASVECGTDVFFLAIVLGALLAIIKDKDIAAGVLIALAMLTRSNAVALLFPALLLTRYSWVPIVIIGFGSYGLYSGFHNMNFLNTAALVTESGRLEELWYGSGARPDSWLDLMNLKTLLAVWDNTQIVFSGLITQLWFFPASVLAVWGITRVSNSAIFLYAVFSIPLLFLIAFDTRYALTLAPCYAIGLGALCD